MAAIHETAYPRLTGNISVATLQQIYSLDEREIVWSRSHRLNKNSVMLAVPTKNSIRIIRDNRHSALCSLNLEIRRRAGTRDADRQCVEAQLHVPDPVFLLIWDSDIVWRVQGVYEHRDNK